MLFLHTSAHSHSPRLSPNQRVKEALPANAQCIGKTTGDIPFTHIFKSRNVMVKGAQPLQIGPSANTSTDKQEAHPHHLTPSQPFRRISRSSVRSAHFTGTPRGSTTASETTTPNTYARPGTPTQKEREPHFSPTHPHTGSSGYRGMSAPLRFTPESAIVSNDTNQSR